MKFNTLNKLLKTKGLVLLLILLIGTSAFSFAADEPEDSYGQILYDIQLITGYDGDLMLDKEISRVEMIAIISKLYPDEFSSYLPPETATFKDVPATHWGFKYVEFAYMKGITNGKGASLFGVDDSVNYNQASIFLIKALGFSIDDVQYETAAYEIGAEYGLKLLLPTDSSKYLKRSEIFEMISKALIMNDASDELGLSMLPIPTSAHEEIVLRITAVINTPVAVYQSGAFFNIYYANGDVYTGEFDGKNIQGNGMTKFANGDLYIGQYKDGVFNGYGIYLWSDNENYEGYWLEGAYHGLGTYTYISGAYQYGEWEDDALVTPIEELSDDDIAAGLGTDSPYITISLTDTDGNPMKGIALSITDQFNGVSHSLVTDEAGEFVIPKTGEFSILSLVLNENSAYSFAITNNSFIVTTAGIYKNNASFELIKR
ncbi:S-layer homology domain-containing protein [Fusibacter bizertensis]|uniref:S-layer homology domain-containing protein n=1 Tax=Fusibacter bizertensis TaxID=1488331 RepID=A0ABT6N804_9FIRM|nr:S-layer homology domain-containing protein [Fusibacter bizertensis]MDH8676531.1 S-layer homology domain-containing protein [Fusibacter bizertensis]